MALAAGGNSELRPQFGLPSAYLLWAPSYEVLKTWKKNPGRAWRKLLSPCVTRLCTEDIRILEFSPQAVCPVPQAETREHLRPSAPTLEVARLFGTALKIPVLELLTAQEQAGLRQAQRDGWDRRHTPLKWKIQTREGVENKLQRLGIKRLLLVDDFATTGRTLDHCASVLLQLEGVAVLSAALGSKAAAAKTSASTACSCGTQPCACIA